MANTTFFRKANEGEMSLRDIFSEVNKKHTPEETAEVFIGGTALTTPKKEEMLAKWKKPFIFAKFFLTFLAVLFLAYVIFNFFGHTSGMFTLLAGLPFLVPVTLMILIWEMHVPRNMSLVEVFKIMAVGGILSIVIFFFMPSTTTLWAGLVEEPVKLIVIYMILKRKNKVYILDGVLIGMAVGTGFAVFETLMYTFNTFGNAIYTYVLGLLEAGVLNNFSVNDILLASGSNALMTALARTFSAIAGHGLYAALYGGGLVMAKGAQEVQLKHLFDFRFLKYFAISIGLHAFNNIGIDLGLPKFFNGIIMVQFVLLDIVAALILLSLLKIGVNEVVKVCADANGGRVTHAVHRAVGGIGAVSAGASSGSEVSLEGIAGPCTGQVYRLADGKSMTIGRVSGKNDIALPSCQNVSSIHCEIYTRNGAVYVKDLNSTNGTFLGEQKLYANQEMMVTNGAFIYLGNKTCGFRIRIQ